MKAEGEVKSENKVKIEKEKALTELYEKARHSNMECSKDVVEAVKNILK